MEPHCMEGALYGVPPYRAPLYIGGGALVWSPMYGVPLYGAPLYRGYVVPVWSPTVRGRVRCHCMEGDLCIESTLRGRSLCGAPMDEAPLCGGGSLYAPLYGIGVTV